MQLVERGHQIRQRHAEGRLARPLDPFRGNDGIELVEIADEDVISRRDIAALERTENALRIVAEAGDAVAIDAWTMRRRREGGAMSAAQCLEARGHEVRVGRVDPGDEVIGPGRVRVEPIGDGERRHRPPPVSRHQGGTPLSTTASSRPGRRTAHRSRRPGHWRYFPV